MDLADTGLRRVGGCSEAENSLQWLPPLPFDEIPVSSQSSPPLATPPPPSEQRTVSDSAIYLQENRGDDRGGYEQCGRSEILHLTDESGTIQQACHPDAKARCDAAVIAWLYWLDGRYRILRFWQKEDRLPLKLPVDKKKVADFIEEARNVVSLYQFQHCQDSIFNSSRKDEYKNTEGPEPCKQTTTLDVADQVMTPSATTEKDKVLSEVRKDSGFESTDNNPPSPVDSHVSADIDADSGIEAFPPRGLTLVDFLRQDQISITEAIPTNPSKRAEDPIPDPQIQVHDESHLTPILTPDQFDRFRAGLDAVARPIDELCSALIRLQDSVSGHSFDELLCWQLREMRREKERILDALIHDYARESIATLREQIPVLAAMLGEDVAANLHSAFVPEDASLRGWMAGAVQTDTSNPAAPPSDGAEKPIPQPAAMPLQGLEDATAQLKSELKRWEVLKRLDLVSSRRSLGRFSDMQRRAKELLAALPPANSPAANTRTADARVALVAAVRDTRQRITELELRSYRRLSLVDTTVAEAWEEAQTRYPLPLTTRLWRWLREGPEPELGQEIGEDIELLEASMMLKRTEEAAARRREEEIRGMTRVEKFWFDVDCEEKEERRERIRSMQRMQGLQRTSARPGVTKLPPLGPLGARRKL